ncbi:unnamed protein product [Urochloa decumbens]|uniref:WRKY domain-containing protein n=1 Tax=Urochloa decumbens TaxID=240449 RepID=A0ABC9CWM5_9POAL
MKQLNGQAGATTGSALVGYYSPPEDTFGPPPSEVSPHDGRKKRKDALSWDKYTCAPYFDGRLWRKYGQKNIKNSHFPRLYFRCSYYEDKHCMASKLIQQVSNDYPPLYKVTYMHEHTCNAAPIPAPDVVAEAELPAVSDGFMLRFGSYGKDYRDARMKQEQRQHNQPMSWSPSELLSFDSWSSQLQHQPALSSYVPPPAAGSSSSFPIAESLPTLPAMSGEGDVLSTCWNSFRGHVFQGHKHGRSLAQLGMYWD